MSSNTHSVGRIALRRAIRWKQPALRVRLVHVGMTEKPYSEPSLDGAGGIVLKKVWMVSLILASSIPAQTMAYPISDNFHFGIESDGPCFPNSVTMNGTDIDVLISSVDGASEGFGPTLSFEPNGHYSIAFFASNGTCTGPPISVSVCFVDQWADPSAFNEVLRSLNVPFRYIPGNKGNVVFTSIGDDDRVYFSGQSVTFEVPNPGTASPGSPDGALYLSAGECSRPGEGNYDVDLSHYLNRAAPEISENLPDTGPSSIASGLFVSVVLIMLGSAFVITSRRRRGLP